MFNNGVTHDVVKDDFDACALALRWLSFMPETMLDLPPVLINPHDPIDRPVDFVPTSTPYDPRHMIAGKHSGAPNPASETNGSTTTTAYLSGFFDRDSFIEILKGWAKTVVCGRARLGGIRKSSWIRIVLF